MLKQGQILKSKSGRRMSPVPYYTNRTLRPIYAWMLKEALEEVEFHDHREWNAMLLSDIKMERFTRSDEDHLSMLLWDMENDEVNATLAIKEMPQ